ncbi:retrovirus-related pol polyprotein from transposon RE1 [Tanacetum coccineum]
MKLKILYGDLQEEVYMEQPLRFVAQGESRRVCFILLVVYVDDIVITCSDKFGIKKLKSFVGTCFETKDLGSLKYFLGIKVSRNSKVICHSQRKYYLDLLDDACQIEAKPCDEPMIPNVISQFLTAPRTSHLDVVTQIFGYLKGTSRLDILYVNHGHHIAEGFIDADYTGCPNTSRSTTGYCVFVGGNLVCWKSKKQNVVSRSSSDVEYRAMAQTTRELVWLRNLLGEIGFTQSKPMKMWCDNQATIYIATNPIFHEKTKHIEVDCHFTREKLEDWTITTLHIRTERQLADVLTKALPETHINSICNKLDMISIYAQLEGEC